MNQEFGNAEYWFRISSALKIKQDCAGSLLAKAQLPIFFPRRKVAAAFPDTVDCFESSRTRWTTKVAACCDGVCLQKRMKTTHYWASTPDFDMAWNPDAIDP